MKKKIAKKEETGKDIFCGIDLHEKTMTIGIAVGAEKAKYSVLNTKLEDGVARLIKSLHDLEAKHPGGSVWAAYEASGFGFGLSDLLEAEGFRVAVLAPTHIPSSSKTRANKTDRKDTERILGVVRGHVLAGNDLPEVWKPDKSLRDDREIVRRHQNIKTRFGDVKNEINGFLRHQGLKKPKNFKSDWSSAHLEWLCSLTESLDPGASVKLKSLLREFEFYKSEAAQMDQELLNLSETDKYKPYVKALTKFKGVGLITSMVFLTELGDMSRFPNRKAVGSYLGLVPRSFETGEAGERKGPISKMGSRRLRKVLNQAAWAAVTWDAEWNSWFNERVQGKKKEKRRFIVAVMRKLAIKMWHRALEVSLEINR